MSIMFSQSTRLELVIVGAALLVLLLCRQPPKSGNAGVVRDMGMTRQQPVPLAADAGQKTEGKEVPSPVPALINPPSAPAQPPLPRPASIAATSDNASPDSTAVPPGMKRMAVVDATQCKSLNYKDVLFGEVTVRRVWDGQKYSWHTVCEVKEKDGTTSTWLYNQRDDVVITPTQPQPEQP
jgi:hypothetical protein